MSGSASTEIIDGDGTDDNIVEDALKAIEDAKQKFNIIRSQRLLVEAVHLGGVPTAKSSDLESVVDPEKCISELEDTIDRICMQESAIQASLETDTIEKIRSSKAVSSELQELLEFHVVQEAQILSKVSTLFEECAKLQEAQNNLAQRLGDYMAYENKRSQQFKESSVSEDKESMQKLRKQLKEMRFMQLLIPRMISQMNNDLNGQEWMWKLCQEVRDPIVSLDDIQ